MDMCDKSLAKNTCKIRSPHKYGFEPLNFNETDNIYNNENQFYEIAFYKNDTIFVIKKKGYKLIVQAKKTIYKKPKCRFRKKAFTKNKALQNRHEELIAYTKPFTIADFNYRIDWNSIRENIIISKPASTYRFSFLVTTENVDCKYCLDENKLLFSDPITTEEVFCIPTSIMSDGNGTVSLALNYKIKRINTSKIMITITANTDWINSVDRQLPITIERQYIVRR